MATPRCHGILGDDASGVAKRVARVVELLRSMHVTPTTSSDYDIGHATGYANCRNDVARALGFTL